MKREDFVYTPPPNQEPIVDDRQYIMKPDPTFTTIAPGNEDVLVNIKQAVVPLGGEDEWPPPYELKCTYIDADSHILAYLFPDCNCRECLWHREQVAKSTEPNQASPISIDRTFCSND